jgi:hypothetical protein
MINNKSICNKENQIKKEINFIKYEKHLHRVLNSEEE